MSYRSEYVVGERGEKLDRMFRRCGRPIQGYALNHGGSPDGKCEFHLGVAYCAGFTVQLAGESYPQIPDPTHALEFVEAVREIADEPKRKARKKKRKK